jgi:hypothetical protein
MCLIKCIIFLKYIIIIIIIIILPTFHNPEADSSFQLWKPKWRYNS